MRFHTIDIGVCTVCVCLTANGEYNDGENTARDCSRGQRETWGDNARYFTCGGDELGFSHSSCEGCGNADGGDRFRLHVMIPLDKYRLGENGRVYVSSRDGSYVEIWQGGTLVNTIERDWRGKRRMYPVAVAA